MSEENELEETPSGGFSHDKKLSKEQLRRIASEALKKGKQYHEIYVAEFGASYPYRALSGDDYEKVLKLSRDKSSRRGQEGNLNIRKLDILCTLYGVRDPETDESIFTLGELKGHDSINHAPLATMGGAVLEITRLAGLTSEEENELDFTKES